ncbi:MAG: hypothetical protein M1127_01640, partial [Patescibacteria group bacterium]|nr:hypothetical protein [Patescibacteria group bacterium]
MANDFGEKPDNSKEINSEQQKRYEFEGMREFLYDFQDYYNEIIIFSIFGERENLQWFLEDNKKLDAPRFFWERYSRYTQEQ